MPKKCLYGNDRYLMLDMRFLLPIEFLTMLYDWTIVSEHTIMVCPNDLNFECFFILDSTPI